MDLVNIIYRYANRFINSEELIELLKNMDTKNFSDNERSELNNLLQEVKETINTTEIKIDQVEINRLTMINRLLDSFDNTKISEEMNDKAKKETIKFIEKTHKELLEDKEKVRDSGPRYEKLFEILTHFPLYNKACLQMDDLELLEFITQYISVPLPPPINQEYFDDLIEVGIKEDKRESIWRMAMNYNRKGKDFSKIVDYFIEKRDDYYLAELISGVEEDLDLDSVIDKALKTEDIEFLRKMTQHEFLMPIFTDVQKEKVKKKIQKGKKEEKK